MALWHDIIQKIYDSTNTLIKVGIQAGTNVMGKTRLVTATGDEVTEDTGNTVVVSFSQAVLSVVSSTAAVSGDNTLVAAPGASNRLVLVGYTMQNESATATTMILYNGASTDASPIARILGQNQGDGVSTILPGGRLFRLTANKALVLNLSGANSCGYTMWYYTEAV